MLWSHLIRTQDANTFLPDVTGMYEYPSTTGYTLVSNITHIAVLSVRLPLLVEVGW